MIYAVALLLLLAYPGEAAAQVEELLRGLSKRPNTGGGLTDVKIGEGLKQALQVGTENAVGVTGRVDGFFKNEAIKILVPDRLRTMERGLRAVGQGAQIDAFVLSMNRAAERAAPAAKSIFWAAIAAMGFEDARRIFEGGNTAATEYFRGKTTDKLTAAFAPVVSKAMSETGVTRQYKELTGRAQALPLSGVESFDLDRYVVGKALDGLFLVVGEEERKIRTNPAARSTEVLKDVFGR